MRGRNRVDEAGGDPRQGELFAGYEEDDSYLADPDLDEIWGAEWDDEWFEEVDEEFPPFELVFGDGVYLPRYDGGVMHLLPFRLVTAETLTWEQVLPWERWREHCYDELDDPIKYLARLIGWLTLRAEGWDDLESWDDYYRD